MLYRKDSTIITSFMYDTIARAVYTNICRQKEHTEVCVVSDQTGYLVCPLDVARDSWQTEIQLEVNSKVGVS